MRPTCRRFYEISTLALFASLTLCARADQWTVPTAEELSMTSQPQVPGAAAVYLFREEKTEDNMHMYSEYVRLKILTEGGKDRANVEIKYSSGGEMGYSVTDIAGRTIHPDGSIVAFTGKPYERVMVKAHDFKRKAKVFTLPDVTVGSIIEYRYKIRWEDFMYSAPTFIVQNDLYLRKGHFVWYPTGRELTTNDERGQMLSTVAWTPILPEGVVLKRTSIPGGGITQDGKTLLEVNIQDVPPSPDEEYMPPISSLGYRVMFYFSPYRTIDEYWKGEGKHWAKLQDKFIGPGPAVGGAVQQLITASDSQEQKLKKIYAAVEQLDNTDFNRQHMRVEDKAQGLSNVKTTDDIWRNKRGTSDQITELFVAMARAAGMKAYVAAVTDRDRSLFYRNYLSTYQLDDDVAIVNVDGKEQFFDPGSRYCAYGHLAPKHADTGGLRETDGATSLVVVPGENYQATLLTRVANLTMDETGTVKGRIDLTFTGAPALHWRQKALTDDRETVDKEMKEHVEQMLPSNMDVKLVSIDKLENSDEPLKVTLEINGPIGSATGKRYLIPGDIFEQNSKPTFAHEKRELAVWLPYRYTARDAIRISLPPTLQVESMPSGAATLPKMATYDLKSTQDQKSVTIRRNLFMAEIMFMPKEYPDLRTFYTQFEAKDQEPIILKVNAAAQASKSSSSVSVAATAPSPQ